MEANLKIEMLRKMILIRYFENRWGEYYAPWTR
jgi:TPP-dependent pyruvate/acetoin dehydrogenase alpha subunit